MAHFYAEIQGNRGEVTRCGSKTSGMYGHIRGWDVGVQINIHHDEETDSDIVRVWRTSGSNGRKAPTLLAVFTDGTVNALRNPFLACKNGHDFFTDGCKSCERDQSILSFRESVESVA